MSMRGSGIVPIYVCCQCGDVLIDNELYSKGKDDCDEGYIKYDLPLVLVRHLKARGIREALTGTVMAYNLNNMPKDPMKAFDWVFNTVEGAFERYAAAVEDGDAD